MYFCDIFVTFVVSFIFRIYFIYRIIFGMHNVNAFVCEKMSVYDLFSMFYLMVVIVKNKLPRTHCMVIILNRNYI